MKLRSLLPLAALALACVAVPARARDLTLKFGHQVQQDAPLSFGTKKFAEIVAAKSGGKIKVTEFPGAVLGGEQQQLSAAQGGVLDITMPSATIMGGVIK